VRKKKSKSRTVKLRLAHSPHQPSSEPPLRNLSSHAALSKGGESAHRRTTGAPPAHHRRRRTQNRLHKAACFAIVCFMKMNAPERNSFFRNEGEPCNTQYIVVACSFLYIIQFISHFFKGKIAVLSFLYMRNDDLHNIFRLSLCIIFLIFLVLELL
jgi:hypothetical protein